MKDYTPLTELLAWQARPAQLMTEVEPKLKLIHPYQQQISID